MARLGVAGLAAVLYLVNLIVSGFPNTYDSAAALSASQSWSAWFFGSIDASNFITVDKPPFSTIRPCWRRDRRLLTGPGRGLNAAIVLDWLPFGDDHSR